MANTPDLASCVAATADGDGGLLPLSPFYALHYHFGMLLGVDDFETEQAYHRAKMRLHSAWLHRAGVVWGFNVLLGLKEEKPPAKVHQGEVRVLPGLALDAAGHELHLEADACLHVGKWFETHEKEVKTTDIPNGKQFDAHVVIHFKACLTRQVPALREPCQGANGDTAYSRVFETVEILLRPGKAPVPAVPYHRLRLLFGLDEPVKKNGAVVPDDQQVLDERNNLLALDLSAQPAGYLKAFRRFAALDEIDLEPARSADNTRTLLFPGGEDTVVVLADLTGLTLIKGGGGWQLTGGQVDTSVRPSHVATAALQELLCAALFRDGAGPADPAGPRVLPQSVQFVNDTTIKFQVDSDLLFSSITPDAFAVSWFDPATGWHRSTIDIASLNPPTRTVTLTLHQPMAGSVVRLIARGTGEAPLLGANLVPLAGATSGPPATRHDGHDFVFMHKRS
jgi:hypothetical protein